MTERSRTYLKGRFEQNDIPQGTDYEDLIDSFLTLQASAEQTMNGKLDVPEVSAATATINTIKSTMVSAETVHVEKQLFNSYVEVSALGTVQGSAAGVSADVTRAFVTDPADRGLVVDDHHAGRICYVIADASNVTAATVFPPSGNNFIGTAANGGVLLAAGQTIQIIAVNASAFSYQRY